MSGLFFLSLNGANVIVEKKETFQICCQRNKNKKNYLRNLGMGGGGWWWW
jgi:hypothetical protein